MWREDFLSSRGHFSSPAKQLISIHVSEESCWTLTDPSREAFGDDRRWCITVIIGSHEIESSRHIYVAMGLKGRQGHCGFERYNRSTVYNDILTPMLGWRFCLEPLRVQLFLFIRIRVCPNDDSRYFRLSTRLISLFQKMWDPLLVGTKKKKWAWIMNSARWHKYANIEWIN